MPANIIQLLPESIANQIAAGEVVQRPASVVKELMENAIDAGATEITVIIKDAGKSLIQVIDNGCGMSETDARMCFERHATSKIRTSDDLFAIRSFGFRGEAMASIAAVAQVELKTRLKGSELGTLVRIEASKIKTHESTATPEGTSVMVKNLFFNVPARRNFLKSNPVEMAHISDEFIRVALAHPEYHFQLFHNDLPVYQLPGGKLAQRITGIFGNGYRPKLIALNEDSTSLLKIWGYVGKPEAAKRTRGEQYFFVNKRFIKNGYLHHAVTSAYERLLPAETHPFYVIFLEIDPKHIDINVHPTKTEIKFDDERTIYGLLHAAVRKSVNGLMLGGSLEFDIPNTLEQILHLHQNTVKPTANINTPSATQAAMGNQQHLAGWQRVFGHLDYKQIEQEFEREAYQYPPQNTPRAEPAEQLENTDRLAAIESKDYSFFQLHRKYILAQVKSGLMLIRQDLAHERILYDRYMLKAHEGNQAAVQTILFPYVVDISPGDFVLMQEIVNDIKAFGFEVEVFGKHSYLIKGVPAGLEGIDSKELFEQFLEQIKNFRKTLTLPQRSITALALAKRTAIKAGKLLNDEEMKSLVDQLFACPTPNYTPEGMPIIAMLSHHDLEALF